MEKFKVLEKTEHSITFATQKEMESAYNLIIDGKQIIIYDEKNGVRNSEIFSGKILTDVMDGKFKMLSKESI